LYFLIKFNIIQGFGMIADRFRDDGERGIAMGIVSIALGLGPIGKSKNKNS
jgi:hypothetical protein